MEPTSPRLPTYFISHGGGPWPWMEESAGGYARLAAALADMPRQIGRTPRAILMVSAHWEAPAFTAQAHPRPPMLYDYNNFPPHTYQVHYDAPGAPELARRVQGLVTAAGLPAALDTQRGFDHGLFAPMAVMYPRADVPVAQLSLRSSLDPAEHIALGRALAPLRDEDVLIVGSGLSYHNLRALGPAGAAPSRAFDAWLQETLVHATPAARVQRLIDWEAAPAARAAHPREEHLLPLMVAVGAAGGDAAECVYHEDAFLGGVAVSSFRFGAAPGEGG